MHKLADFIYNDASNINNKINLSELNEKTIMITGATGLVGTYFMASLKYASDKNGIKTKVIALVHSEPDKYYLDLLPSDTKILKGDLTDYEFLKNLPKADFIIHAAGYGQPGRFLDNPIKTLKLNTLSTFFLLEKLNPLGKFMFVSTSEVYSGSEKIPYSENDIGNTNTTHNRACYIEGKRSGETISFAYKTKGVSTKVARLSLAYGPGTKKGDQRVLNSFISKALGGEIAMLDSGNAKRTYCYVTDAVEIMWKILLSGNDFIYNVGGESKVTISNLAKKIGAYLNVPVKIPKEEQKMSGAPDDVWLDLTKIKKEFNKIDFISLDNGLEKTIEWQKILYNNKKT